MVEKKAVYEGLFILDANRLARDRGKLPGEVDGLIKAVGGEIEVSRLWEERRLAYPINGQRKGAYWITYFHLNTQKMTELARSCDLKEGILRQLFVRLPDPLVQAILDHAKGIVADPEPTEPEPKGPPKPTEPKPTEPKATEPKSPETKPPETTGDVPDAPSEAVVEEKVAAR